MGAHLDPTQIKLPTELTSAVPQTAAGAHVVVLELVLVRVALAVVAREGVRGRGVQPALRSLTEELLGGVAVALNDEVVENESVQLPLRAEREESWSV